MDIEAIIGYLLQVSNTENNLIKILLEKWITFNLYFSGEVTIPLCMMALGKLLIQKYELLNGISVSVENEVRKAPSAILKTFLQYITNSNEEKENINRTLNEQKKLYNLESTEELCNGDYFDEDFDVRHTKDLDLKIYPEINTCCNSMVFFVLLKGTYDGGN